MLQADGSQQRRRCVQAGVPNLLLNLLLNSTEFTADRRCEQELRLVREMPDDDLEVWFESGESAGVQVRVLRGAKQYKKVDS